MQTDLVSRIEKIWSMADIALKHGSVDYGMNGHSKIAHVSGFRFNYINDVLVRILGSRLDVSITHHSTHENIVQFPGTQTIVQFTQGSDEILNRCYEELLGLQRIFTGKRAA